MVYLVAGLAAVAAACLSGMFYVLLQADRSASDTPHEALTWSAKEELERLRVRVAEIEEAMPVLRAEIAEGMRKAESTFRSARAAEERTRKMAGDAYDDDGEGDPTQLSIADLAGLRNDSGASDAEQQAPTMRDLERLAFERRHAGRR